MIKCRESGDIAAAAGRAYEQTDSFREFARLQLPSGWFRISEDIEWSTED